MINVKDDGIILERTNHPFEDKAVISPACVQDGAVTKMFYRAVRRGNGSTIGYAEFEGTKLLRRLPEPVIIPEFEYEQRGVEDPRIVFFEGQYYVFYTAYDGVNARGALASSTDLKTFKKMGLITPSITYKEAIDLFKNSRVRPEYEAYGRHYMQEISDKVMLWGKDILIFPRRINGKIAFLYRVMPGIQIAYVDSLHTLVDGAFWRDQLTNLRKHILMDPLYKFESRKIGVGAPPIETPDGWVFIYHSVEITDRGHVYCASAALLDLNDPQKVIGRLKEPLFYPDQPWEVKGEETNVIFPTSAIVEPDGRLYVYAGAADTCVVRKSVDLKELLNALKKSN